MDLLSETEDDNVHPVKPGIVVLAKYHPQYGNTVVVIEHNLDVVKTGDWVVDLGPEGGSRGGQIVATGTPEAVSKNPKSLTGSFLAPLMAKQTISEQP